jgi:hypothetical protein
MPSFVLDTSGAQQVWRVLSPFTQGFIEAMYWAGLPEGEDQFGRKYAALGLVELDYSALCKVMEDCKAFEERAALLIDGRHRTAGNDFYLTRNGHGCGFWDGGWPEPQASELAALAETFGEFDLYVGDDRKIHRSDV